MFYILVLFVVYIIVYRQFFGLNLLSWGDAPYFYPENLKELFNLPLLWNSRTDNFGANQSHILWLYLPTFLFGVLNEFIGLNHEILIRLIFYFPATILALVGSWLFIGRFTNNIFAKFAGAFLYGFNTYFLMLLDGGQIGVALAYGLFPLCVFSIYRYIFDARVRNLILLIFSLFLILNTDPRIAILVFVFISLLILTEVILIHKTAQVGKVVLGLVGSFLALILLNLFWIVPLFTNSAGLVVDINSEVSLVKILNALTLFQPQFPINEFGRSLPIPKYFYLFPIILFSGLLVIKKFKTLEYKYLGVLGIIYIVFAFLSKDGNEPFGNFYSWLITYLPFGIAFRDSSKFFIPLLLAASLLLSLSVVLITQIVKNKYLGVSIKFLLVSFLILIIHPAISGNLTGALGVKKSSADYQKIYLFLKNEPGFFRTLWFDEKPPLGFADWQHPAISANLLHKERPFASMIDGTYDLYNFLHSPQIHQWLDLLGIKYVFFPDNERKKVWSSNDLVEREQFMKFVRSVFPGFKLPQPRDHIFGINKMIFVVGGEGIYKKFFTTPDFDLSKQGFVFLESGKFYPADLNKFDPASYSVLFEQGKDDQDLAMTFDQNNFINLANNHGRWGYRSSADYLGWKNELLKNNISTYDFDFGKGVAFSNIKNESFSMKLSVRSPGEHYLGIRHINASDSGKLRVSVNNTNFFVVNPNNKSFKWSLIGPIKLDNKFASIEVVNEGGAHAVNTLYLLDSAGLNLLQRLSQEVMNKNRSTDQDMGRDYIPVNYTTKVPTKYQVTIPEGLKWLMFSDHFDPGWKLGGSSAFPAYAMINTFYVGNLTGEATLSYDDWDL